MIIGFVDRINRGDIGGLVEMMSEDHRLEVFDEKPVVGRDANKSAWRGYMTAYPRGVI
jgi:ketosteroid isomerase-like protein